MRPGRGQTRRLRQRRRPSVLVRVCPPPLKNCARRTRSTKERSSSPPPQALRPPELDLFRGRSRGRRTGAGWDVEGRGGPVRGGQMRGSCRQPMQATTPERRDQHGQAGTSSERDGIPGPLPCGGHRLAPARAARAVVRHQQLAEARRGSRRGDAALARGLVFERGDVLGMEGAGWQGLRAARSVRAGASVGGEKTWLLRTGWQMHGAISCREVPSRRTEDR
jgi:hypothetical protein